MPIWYRPLPARPVFHVVYSGTIGLREVLGFFDRFETDFRRYPDHLELCDATGISDIAISDRELRCVIALVIGIYRRNDCRKRIAFVAPCGIGKTAFEQVVYRFRQELPVVKCGCFDSEGAALQYLGLPADFLPKKAMH